MRAFLAIHRRIAERPGPSPAPSSLPLAAADEFSHAEGVSAPEGKSEHCFEREQEADETAFRLLDEDVNLDRRYFTRVERSKLANRAERICIELPLLEEGRPAHPSHVLSMLVLHIEPAPPPR